MNSGLRAGLLAACARIFASLLQGLGGTVMGRYAPLKGIPPLARRIDMVCSTSGMTSVGR